MESSKTPSTAEPLHSPEIYASMAFLKGSRVSLRPLQESDYKGPYPGWLNDREVCAGNGHHYFPLAVEEARDFIHRCRNSHDQLVLAIVRQETNAHIGNIALKSINWIHRSAELAILLGDKNSWGQGFGLEASQLIIRHGFEALNLQRVACGTFSSNHGMLRLAENLGMVREGIRRKAIYKEGAWLDIVEFGLLREEFRDTL